MLNKILDIFANIGRRLIDQILFFGASILMFLEVCFYMKNAFSKRGEILRQLYNASVRTFMVISIVAVFTGMILSLQTGLVLATYRMESQIGNIIIASLTREMGPFTAAIILIASVGSTMAAELGTMKVSEEIDALEVMSINPIKFLVMPRVVAMIFAMPIATIYVIILGVFGGGVVAYSHLHLPFEVYYAHVLQSLHLKAVYVGLLKSVVFGICIASISCSHGLKAADGAMGVGRATRNSVVASFLIILIVGYFITEIFFREGL